VSTKIQKSEKVESKYKNLIFWVLTGLIYLALAIIFTWPLAKHINSSIIGQPDFTDGPFFLWNIWWVKKALLTFHNLFFSNFVYYPANANLSLHTLTLTTALIALPLLPFFKLITTLNIIQLASIIGSALGMVALVGYLTKNKYAGFVSGLIFAFCPYIFGHLQAGHYNLTMLWPIPLVTLFFFKTLREKSYLNPVLAGIFLLAISYLDVQLMVYALILLLLIFIFELIFGFRKTLNLQKIVFYLIIIAIYGVGFALPYLLNLKEFWSHRELLPTYSNGDLQFILGKNPLNPWWGAGKLKVVEAAVGSYRENTVALGFTPILLAILAFVPIRNLIREKFLFLVISLVGFLLALGPHFQVRQVLFPVNLPFFYLQKLPLFNMGIVPTRFIVLAYFGLAVLAGIFMANIILIFNKRFLKYFVYVAVPIFSVVVGIEYYSGQMRMDNFVASPIYQEIKNNQGDFSVLPVLTKSDDGYFQTIHDKKMVSGFLGRRINGYYLEQYKKEPLLGYIASGETFNLMGAPRPEDKNRELVLATLKKYKIRYLIVDDAAKRPDEIENVRKYLEGTLGFKVWREDASVVVYKLDI